MKGAGLRDALSADTETLAASTRWTLREEDRCAAMKTAVANDTAMVDKRTSLDRIGASFGEGDAAIRIYRKTMRRKRKVMKP